ncbi:MAG: multiprotein bridging factor aMBF1 [Archaeoglobaceae archaeon]
MNCEICGKPISRGYKVVVEGSEVTVCASCKQHGSEKPSLVSQPGVRKVAIPKRRPQTKISFEYELIDDFHEVVRRERERRGWSQEELAKRIQEKESLIKKIERGEITPEPEVVEKLERVFGVSLRENVPEVKVEGGRPTSLTLGDVVVVRKKKK